MSNGEASALRAKDNGMETPFSQVVVRVTQRQVPRQVPSVVEPARGLACVVSVYTDWKKW